MLEAASIAPNFDSRRSLTPAELCRLDDPAAIFEYEHVDSNGEVAYIYTVAGWLDGDNVIDVQGGCTIGGDVMIVHADNRAAADDVVCVALEQTIDLYRACPEGQKPYSGIIVDGGFRPLH